MRLSGCPPIRLNAKEAARIKIFTWFKNQLLFDFQCKYKGMSLELAIS